MIRILVVDDELIARREIAETLTEVCEMEAETVSNAEDCLDRLREAAANGVPFDAVVLDIFMPGRNGDEIVPEIRRDYPFTAIIMLTAFSSAETARETLRQGVYQYLEKNGSDTERILAPVLRAGVAQHRLKRLRQELLGPSRPSNLYSHAAQVIRETIELPSNFFLVIASPHNDALEICAWDQSGQEIRHEQHLSKDHPLARRIFDERKVVRWQLNKNNDSSQIQPLESKTQSLMAAPIREVGGEPGGFVDLECCVENYCFDEHTKDVLVALAELVALDRGITNRIETAQAQAHAAQISATSKEVAHYIRNAVHVLRSSFGLLRESAALGRTPGESADVLAAKVGQHLQHEDNLDEIEGVLMQMSAIGQELVLAKKPIRLEEAFASREKNYQAMAECAKARFVFTGPAREVWVHADEKQLLRAIDMLVENAVEACTIQPTTEAVVELTLTFDDRYARIFVRDNGPGFTDEERTNLFKAQFSTKANVPLRGIGLFTAKRIVLEHDGRIAARDITPSGAEFTIELPLDRSQSFRSSKPVAGIRL